MEGGGKQADVSLGCAGWAVGGKDVYSRKGRMGEVCRPQWRMNGAGIMFNSMASYQRTTPPNPERLSKGQAERSSEWLACVIRLGQS